LIRLTKGQVVGKIVVVSWDLFYRNFRWGGKMSPIRVLLWCCALVADAAPRTFFPVIPGSADLIPD
jgi:hypothetical protein